MKALKLVTSYALCSAMIFSSTSPFLAFASESATESLSVDSVADADSQTDADTEFSDYLAEQFKLSAEADRLSAHFCLADSDNLNYDSDYSLGSFDDNPEENLTTIDEMLASLEAFDYDALSLKYRQIYDNFYYMLLKNRALSSLPDYSATLGSLNGILPNISINVTEYYLLSEGDVKNFLSILEDFPRFFNELKKELEHQISIGFPPSSYDLDYTIDYCNQMAEETDHPFLAAFKDNIKEAGLDDAAVSNYISQAEDLLKTAVLPAYADFAAYLETLQPSAVESTGLCNYPSGAEYYEALVSLSTGSEKPAEELLSYLQEKLEKAITDLTMIYMTNPDIEEKAQNISLLTTKPDDLLKLLQTCMLNDFPAIEIPDYTVSYLPKALEVDGQLAYYIPSPYGLPNRNVIRANKSALSEDLSSLWSTLAHEGFPGHLYQYQYLIQNSMVSPIEMLIEFTGTSEGWAYVAEEASLKWLDIDEDTAEYLFLSKLIGMDVSSILDIGLNYAGWTFDDADQLITKYYGAQSNETVQEIIQSVYSDPGVLLPYTVGYYELTDLFTEAEDFYPSQKDIYTAFLSIGNMAFPILEKYMLTESTEESGLSESESEASR